MTCLAPDRYRRRARCRGRGFLGRAFRLGLDRTDTRAPAWHNDRNHWRHGRNAAKSIGDELIMLEVVVFPLSMRGAGEGHYAWDRIPDTTLSDWTTTAGTPARTHSESTRVAVDVDVAPVDMLHQQAGGTLRSAEFFRVMLRIPSRPPTEYRR